MNNLEAFEAIRQGIRVYEDNPKRDHKYIIYKNGRVIDDKKNLVNLFDNWYVESVFKIYRPRKKITLYRAKVYKNKSGCLFTSSSWEYHQKFDDEVLEWETIEVEVDE